MDGRQSFNGQIYYKFCSNIEQLRRKINTIDFSQPELYKTVYCREKLITEGLAESKINKVIAQAQQKNPNIELANCNKDIKFIKARDIDESLLNENLHLIEIGVNKYFLKNSLIKKIDQGGLDIDITIDLHKLDLALAYKSLNECINTAYQNHQRLILLITGKGYNSSNGGNISCSQNKKLIKNNILDWINNNRNLLSKVYYVNFAHLKHGGEGALYIYLR